MARPTTEQLVHMRGVKEVGTYQTGSPDTDMKRNPSIAPVYVHVKEVPGGGPKVPANPSVPLGSTYRR